MSHGEGVERVFSLFSPNIDNIEVVRKGDVKRANYIICVIELEKVHVLLIVIEEKKLINMNYLKLLKHQLQKQHQKRKHQHQQLIVEEKSESPASKAENTEDESK